MNDSDPEVRYKYYYSKGKRHYNQHDYVRTLEALKNAFNIKPSGELQTKINKIEDLVSNSETKENVQFKANANKVLIDDRFYVNSKCYDKLYNYQKEGVLWLFKLFESRRGGILADDMGLGKTVQIIFFLRELFESELIKTVLLVMPKSLLINWEREFSKWAPDLKVMMYTENERKRNLNKVNRRGGILLTTYGTVLNSWEELNCDSSFKWDILALDEGHKIKNPSSKTFKAINAIRANMRLVMTGTAVQNKLKELWALFDFTHQGSLLGGYTTFAIEYERPLTQSRNKDATESEKIYGDDIAESLKKLIKPFFLRRTKEEVTKMKASNDVTSVPKLMRKNDLIIWVKMTAPQIDIYQRFLELDDIKQLLTSSEKRSPLLELNVLKKICDHPRLLNSDHLAEMGLSFAKSIQDVDILKLQEESGKMGVLLKLLKQLTDNDHKCLVFSQSKVVLNIIERIMKSNEIIFLRLDGDVLKTEDRQHIVDSFNNDSMFKVLLLTSQVGGVGLTLTGADRAIIYDLNWNPSIDAQAVDRIYRIGQEKNVVVYRFITCGTVEEKIYRRQIFKDSVNRQTTGVKETDHNPFRYFTQGELRELFTMDDPKTSKTQMQLEKMHSKFRKSDALLDEHVVWLMDQNIFGITDHDLMFSQEEESVSVDDETRGRLLVNRNQAEGRLVKEALSLATDEEAQLRQMMSKMSLKKVKEQVNINDMFIPSRMDIKKPGYNVLPDTTTVMSRNKLPKHMPKTIQTKINNLVPNLNAIRVEPKASIETSKSSYISVNEISSDEDVSQHMPSGLGANVDVVNVSSDEDVDDLGKGISTEESVDERSGDDEEVVRLNIVSTNASDKYTAVSVDEVSTAEGEFNASSGSGSTGGGSTEVSADEVDSDDEQVVRPGKTRDSTGGDYVDASDKDDDINNAIRARSSKFRGVIEISDSENDVEEEISESDGNSSDNAFSQRRADPFGPLKSRKQSRNPLQDSDEDDEYFDPDQVVDDGENAVPVTVDKELAELSVADASSSGVAGSTGHSLAPLPGHAVAYSDDQSELGSSYDEEILEESF